MEKVVFCTKYTNPPKVDCESYEPGTSLTIPDQVEPLQVIVNRCLRGELVKVRENAYYDGVGIESEDDMFNTLDPTTSPGFDLADASSLLSQATQVAQVGEADAEPASVGAGEDKLDSKTQSEESSALV